MTAEKNFRGKLDSDDLQLNEVDRGPMFYSNITHSAKDRKEIGNSSFKRIGFSLLQTIVFFILVYVVTLFLPADFTNNLTFLAVTLAIGIAFFIWRSSRN